MIDFEYYKLLNNPFRISPSINPEELIWAGMRSLKKKIDDRIEICIKTTPSRIVLNWGRYGSGKTHAANFYTKTDYIKKKFDAETKNIKVNLPRSTKEPVQSFLRALVGQLDFNNIVDDFQKFKSIYEEESKSIIDSYTQDSVISQALKLLLGTVPIGQGSLFGEADLPANVNAMKNFLYGDTSKAVLKQLNIPLGLDDDEQVVNLISGIFNVITYEKNLYKCVFLWIDEFEDIDTLPKTSQDRFTTFLRQLIEKSPNNLTIFLNFTLKGVGELEDLSITLGEALSSRTKLYIDFETPDIAESKDYIKELINHPRHRRTEDIDASNIFYPFEEEAVKNTLEEINQVSTRKINETFSLILELALISPERPIIIDNEFITKVKGEIPSLMK